jgi:hypothetical protein
MANDYIVVDTNAVQNLFAGGGVTVTLAITPKLHQTQLCLGVTVTVAITPKLRQTQLCLGGEGARSTRKRWERFRLDTQLFRFQSGAKLAEPN